MGEAQADRREREATEIADRLIDALSRNGVGGCICDGDENARALVIKAIVDAMVKECETT